VCVQTLRGYVSKKYLIFKKNYQIRIRYFIGAHIYLLDILCMCIIDKMVAKQGWNIIKKPDSLVKKLLKPIYSRCSFFSSSYSLS